MSPRAGSIPPMTSTTTSARATRADASSVSSAGSMPGRGRSGRRTAMPTSSRRCPHPGGEVVVLLGEQPGDLGAHDATAQQGDSDRIHGGQCVRGPRLLDGLSRPDDRLGLARLPRDLPVDVAQGPAAGYPSDRRPGVRLRRPGTAGPRRPAPRGRPRSRGGAGRPVPLVGGVQEPVRGGVALGPPALGERSEVVGVVADLVEQGGDRRLGARVVTRDRQRAAVGPTGRTGELGEVARSRCC